MSIPNIRNALERALAGISPAIDLVHENEKYTSTAGTPYMEAYLLKAPPDNPTLGDGFSQERGVFFLKLKYPLQKGPAAAEAQAELIRTVFTRGASFADGGITTQIAKKAEIGTGQPDGDRWVLPVRIPWFANIYT